MSARYHHTPEGRAEILGVLQYGQVKAIAEKCGVRPSTIYSIRSEQRTEQHRRMQQLATNGRRIFHLQRPELLSDDGFRWTAGRKAMAVEAVRKGDLSLPDLLKKHDITAEEFSTWAARYDRGGRSELRLRNSDARRRDLTRTDP